MFSIIFPGQGSQFVGMAKEFYKKYSLVKNIFSRADEALNFNLSKIILSGPISEINLTKNTQPAIFVVSYSIFSVMKEEFNIDLNQANYFAGHSLGEYTALSCAGALSFSATLKLLRVRGKAMQEAAPKGEGGMIAILGSTTEIIEKIFEENKNNYECYIANDNSNGQIVVSGKLINLDLLIEDLKKRSIKSIKLTVSAPFHCKLMNNATKIMQDEIQKYDFKNLKNILISNVTAQEVNEISILKELLIKQIESRVRWRESVNLMLEKKITQFIEIGPGKVLSGLIKRIDRNVKVTSINTEDDIKQINLND